VVRGSAGARGQGGGSHFLSDCKGGGRAYQSLGDYAKAIAYHTQDLAIAKEVGDRVEKDTAYGNLGCAYQTKGAIQHYTQDLAIAKEVGDRAGEGGRTGTSASCISSRGTSERPSSTRRSAWWEVGDRAGEGRALGNLGTCHMYLNDFVKAVAHRKEQHALAISLKLAHVQSDAALNMGVLL